MLHRLAKLFRTSAFSRRCGFPRIIVSVTCAAAAATASIQVLQDLTTIVKTAFEVEHSLWTATLAIGYWHSSYCHSMTWFIYVLAFRTVLQSERKRSTLMFCAALFVFNLLQGGYFIWTPDLPLSAGILAILFVILVRLFAIDLTRAGIDLGTSLRKDDKRAPNAPAESG